MVRQAINPYYDLDPTKNYTGRTDCHGNPVYEGDRMWLLDCYPDCCSKHCPAVLCEVKKTDREDLKRFNGFGWFNCETGELVSGMGITEGSPKIDGESTPGGHPFDPNWRDFEWKP